MPESRLGPRDNLLAVDPAADDEDERAQAQDEEGHGDLEVHEVGHWEKLRIHSISGQRLKACLPQAPCQDGVQHSRGRVWDKARPLHEENDGQRQKPPPPPPPKPPPEKPPPPPLKPEPPELRGAEANVVAACDESAFKLFTNP